MRPGVGPERSKSVSDFIRAATARLFSQELLQLRHRLIGFTLQFVRLRGYDMEIRVMAQLRSMRLMAGRDNLLEVPIRQLGVCQ